MEKDMLGAYKNLLIDRIILGTNINPVLFTCFKNDELYVICLVKCDKNIAKWLLTKTDENTIIDMLEDKISVREAFLKHPESQITITRNFTTDNMEVSEHIEEDWCENSIYLPKKGEYIDADPGEFDEIISYYKKKQENTMNRPQEPILQTEKYIAALTEIQAVLKVTDAIPRRDRNRLNEKLKDLVAALADPTKTLQMFAEHEADYRLNEAGYDYDKEDVKNLADELVTRSEEWISSSVITEDIVGQYIKEIENVPEFPEF